MVAAEASRLSAPARERSGADMYTVLALICIGVLAAVVIVLIYRKSGES